MRNLAVIPALDCIAAGPALDCIAVGPSLECIAVGPSLECIAAGPSLECIAAGSSPYVAIVRDSSVLLVSLVFSVGGSVSFALAVCVGVVAKLPRSIAIIATNIVTLFRIFTVLFTMFSF